MKITDVETITFQYMSQRGFDLAGHSHPTTPYPATQSLTRIMTDEGVDGYCFGGVPELNDRVVKPVDRPNGSARKHKNSSTTRSWSRY